MANEKRLIDANALEGEAICLYTYGGARYIPLAALKRAPTVEAVEVAQGRWTPLVKNGFSFGVTCSECNTTWDDKSNFCPNCGADMRKRKDNE